MLSSLGCWREATPDSIMFEMMKKFICYINRMKCVVVSLHIFHSHHPISNAHPLPVNEANINKLNEFLILWLDNVAFPVRQTMK